MAMELFSEEYQLLKELVEAEKFDEPLRAAMQGLRKIFGADGFDDACGPSLDLLRGLLFLKEDERTLASAGIDPASNTAPGADALRKAAAVKFLRHLYLTQQRGGQKVWVFDSPKAYSHYPSGELDAVKSNLLGIKGCLRDKAEQFGSQRRTALGAASTTGLAWCMKTNMALATAKSDPGSAAMKTVKRWFADGSTTDAELGVLVGKLSAGFKKITATINSNQLIFTDMASVRGATAGKEKDLLGAYAFVFAGRYEKIPVIYIENAYFSKNSTPIPDHVLWAITVVHEITHLDVSTKDHVYDYDGLQPGTKITVAEAAENADSWAYFCADCAGALSDSHVGSAMSGW